MAKPLPPLKVGFIGGSISSAIGYTHFNASRLDGHFMLQAGCFSRSEDINIRSAHTYGVDETRVYSTWQELLSAEQGNLDAVVILTPIPSHTEIVLAAI